MPSSLPDRTTSPPGALPPHGAAGLASTPPSPEAPEAPEGPERAPSPAGVQDLVDAGALLEGHFRLSSGLHSNRYVQCALLFEAPARGRRMCSELAARVVAALGAASVDRVIGAAVGGIVVAHELAAALGVRGGFAERTGGTMELRRGFALAPGERVLIAEDVVTTGGSAAEVAQVVTAAGGTVVGVAAIIDRSQGARENDLPLVALLQVDVTTWSPDDCPLCRQGLPAVKPGSRPAQPRT